MSWLVSDRATASTRSALFGVAKSEGQIVTDDQAGTIENRIED